MKGIAGKKIYRIIGGAALAALAAGILVESEAVTEGIRSGLAVSAGVLVPSLFPFMVLSGFLSQTEWGAVISRPFRIITTHIFKLPAELGAVVLLAMVGGYPVGARTIADLLARKRIDRATAERMLCFCVNAGPSFLITAVGVGMFFDRTAGLILFFTQIAATVLIGAAVSLRVPRPQKGKNKSISTATIPAFVGAVTGASHGVINLCAFAVLFSGLLSLMGELGLVERLAELCSASKGVVGAVVSGFFEVTTGCIAASKLGGSLAFGLVSASVSFCGLSVICQIMSCFRDNPIRFRPFFVSRLVHMALACLLSLPLYNKYCAAKEAWIAEIPPKMITDGKTLWYAGCLLAMCTILLLSGGQLLKSKNSEKSRNLLHNESFFARIRSMGKKNLEKSGGRL